MSSFQQMDGKKTFNNDKMLTVNCKRSSSSQHKQWGQTCIYLIYTSIINPILKIQTRIKIKL